jgi:epoxyqueuosine reductase
MDLKSFINREAEKLGFSAVGIAPAGYDPIGHNGLLRWLDAGYQAGMTYMERAARKRYDPEIHLPGAKSVIVCAQNYYSDPGDDRRKPYVSVYARGEDYHAVLKDKLRALAEIIKEKTGEFRHEIFVDSSPVGEKSLAVRAGIGFIGRNGTVIIPKPGPKDSPLGSFHFIGVIISDLSLEPDAPVVGTCGKCRRCIDACPTNAIVGDGIIDSGLCISYHTTQSREAIPDDIRPKLGNMIFGCDICQTVCPYNKKSVITSEPRLQPSSEIIDIDPDHLRNITEQQFESRFGKSALGALSFEAFKKNAAAVLENIANLDG